MNLSKQFRALKHNRKWYWDLYTSYYYQSFVRKQIPILIFQMGKVGSTSLAYSLPKETYPLVYHIHVMNEKRLKDSVKAWEDGVPLNYHLIQTGYFALNHIIRPKRPCKIITMTRDPIARNVSAFFENFYRHTGQRFESTNLSMDEMIAKFLETDHSVPIQWFDYEFKDVLGIDLYEKAFPKEEGFLRIQSENIDLLVYKSEIDIEKQNRIVADFLGDSTFKLSLGNVSSDKIYSSAYKDMKEHLNFEPAFVDEMLNSKYTRHFYSDEEIAAMRLRWLRPEKV